MCPSVNTNRKLKMKKLSTAILVMAASAGFAVAQTAATIPVGYITVTTPAGADSTFSIPLARPAVLSSVATAASGTTLTVKATGITASQFLYAPGSQPNNYYVKFLSGSLTGQFVTITDNAAFNDNGTPADTSDDTVDLTLESAVSITGTPSITIAPYQTLQTAFPGGAGVGTTDAPEAATSFLMVQNQAGVGADRGKDRLFFYYDDGAEGPDNGWYDNDDLEAGKQDDVILYPDDLYWVRNGSESDVSAVFEGQVPSTSTSTSVAVETVVQDNYVGAPFPVDLTLGGSGLIESGAIASTDAPENATDFVMVYDEADPASDKSAAALYFHYDDGASGPDNGWYNNDDLEAGIQDSQPIIKAGRGFVIRKGEAGAPASVNWVAPIPYSLAP